MDQLSVVRGRRAAAEKEQWPCVAGRGDLGQLGPLAAPSTSPAAGTAQHRCPQCSEQLSSLAGCAVAAGAGSPSLPCPVPEAAPREGPSSKPPPPVTLPCPTGSRCHVPPPRHLAASQGQALGDPPPCLACERVHLLGLRRAAAGTQGTFAPRWRWATQHVPVSWLCGC